MTPLKFARGDQVAGITIGTARDKWRAIVAEACTDLRLHCIGRRPPIQYEEALVRAAVAEVLELRLRIAYAPLFAGLTAIERKVEALAELTADPMKSSPTPKTA